MKKFLVTSLAAIVVASLGSAFAQNTASHELRVTIPQVVGIRIQSTPAAEVVPTTVVFDYADSGNQAAYLAAIGSGVGNWLPPTGYSLGEVEVLAVGTGWRVTVAASGSLTTTGIDLDQVRVTPTAGAAFLLDSVSNIATGTATAWSGLGISGASYELFVDGTEDAGDDTITVTYSIFAN